MKKFTPAENPALRKDPLRLNSQNVAVADGKIIRLHKPLEYHEDGSITFNVYAPEAKKVEIMFSTSIDQGGYLANDKLYELQPIGNGEFSFTIGGFKPNRWAGIRYFFDDVEKLYTRGPIFFDKLLVGNWFCTVDPDADYLIYHDIPHGAMRTEWFHSELTGRELGCYVYTPPTYNDDATRRYPVLYLQHGAFNNEGSKWVIVENMMDYLIAEGKCEEMIVVLNNGHQEVKCEESGIASSRADETLRDVIVKECIPFIDSHYRTIPDKAHRAMAGSSMGSNHTYVTVSTYPELFDYAGICNGNIMGGMDPESPAPDMTETPFCIGDKEAQYAYIERMKTENPDEFKACLKRLSYRDAYNRMKFFLDPERMAQYKLIMIGCGMDDPLGKASVPVDQQTMKNLGLNYDNFEVFRIPGGAHDTYSFNTALCHYISEIFKK